MPKKPALRLFTKTWPRKKKDDEDEPSRPLTATLEKPTILDVKFIKKIDMTQITKEFLFLTNICKIPLTIRIPLKDDFGIAKIGVINKFGGENLANNKDTKRLPLTGYVRSKKIKTACVLTTSKSSPQTSPVPKTTDTNNNSKSLKKCEKASAHRIKAAPLKLKGKLLKSNKLPEPCTTCGRPDQPERFHSHPVNPPKITRNKMDGNQKPQVKSTVQKPIAIKYKSKFTESKISPRPPIQTMEAPPPKVPSRPNSAKRTLTCPICSREFGTASLPLHEPKCLEKWERENSSLPPNLRRKIPVKPDTNFTPEQWNDYAWQTSQALLVPCRNCKRTFYPDRLRVHQRSCRTPPKISIFVDFYNKMALAKSKSIEAELQTIATGDENVKDEKPKSFCSKAKLILTNITVEPILVFYVLPSVMASLTTQNLSLEKACRVNLKMDENICDALSARNSSGYSESDEVAVQKLVASMAAWKNVIQSLIPSLLLLFLGSWSDRHRRRKPCILIPIVGEVFTSIGLLLCTYYFYQMPIEFNVFFEAVPPAITGGWFASFMGIFSYISNISTVEMRTLRIGAVNMFSNLSVTIGNALSGILYRKIGFYGVFSLALAMYITSLFYGVFVVNEVPSEEEKKEKVKEKRVGFLKDFFDCTHITETFHVAFKKGERNRRARICTIMVLVMVIIGPLHGEMNVMYLFVRYKFGWDEIDYSIYSTYYFTAHICGTIFSLMFFSKFLQLDDALLGLISSSSKVAASFIYAFAPNATVFYIGALAEILNGTSFIAMRSIISKLVPPDELGKINSLFGVSEALMPLVYGPMYSIVYKATINVLPGAFFLLGGALTSPALFIFLWLYFENRRDLKEEAKNISEKEAMLKKEMEMEMEMAKEKQMNNDEAKV